jgi:hypothetical protein
MPVLKRRLVRQFWSDSPSPAARLLFVAAVLFAGSPFAGAGRAQELVIPAQPAPPPMRYLPDAVRAQIAAAASPKERVAATLGLLEQFLARSEQFTGSQRFDPAAADLGVYQALLDDLLRFLRHVGRSPEGKVDSKTRDLYKRIELTLNKHTARIESIRRVTPAQYAGNVRAAFVHARDRRAEALEAFFVETVVKLPKESDGAHGTPEKGATPARKPTEKPPAP